MNSTHSYHKNARSKHVRERTFERGTKHDWTDKIDLDRKMEYNSKTWTVFLRQRDSLHKTWNMGEATNMVHVVKSAESDAGSLFLAAVDQVMLSEAIELERVAFDCEGVNLSRVGSLEIISICFASKEVFLE